MKKVPRHDLLPFHNPYNMVRQGKSGITLPSFNSELHESLCALWHVTHHFETAVLYLQKEITTVTY